MKAKVSEVLFLEVALKPVADCEDCGWDWDNRFGTSPAKTKAKEHVAATGHTVWVVKETKAKYWLPGKEPEQSEEPASAEST